MSKTMIGLSKSTLETFVDCPRCFWFSKNEKIERPRSPMPSITGGIDRVMKAYTEAQLKDGLANQYLIGSQMQPHPDLALLKKFSDWRTFQGVVEVSGGRQVKAWGMLDALLVDKQGVVSPWDYKSKGDEPEAEADAKKWNQLQADIYHLLLEENGLKVSGFCYFTYAWPTRVATGVIEFDHATVRIPSSRKGALDVLEAAAICLEGSAPESSPGCKYCGFITAREGVTHS